MAAGGKVGDTGEYSLVGEGTVLGDEGTAVVDGAGVLADCCGEGMEIVGCESALVRRRGSFGGVPAMVLDAPQVEYQIGRLIGCQVDGRRG